MDEGVVAVDGKRLLNDTGGHDHLRPTRSRGRVGPFEHRAHHRRRSDDGGRDAGVQHGLLDRQPEPGLGWIGRFVLRTVGGQQHDASDPCLPSDAQHLRHRGWVGARQEEGLNPCPDTGAAGRRVDRAFDDFDRSRPVLALVRLGQDAYAIASREQLPGKGSTDDPGRATAFTLAGRNDRQQVQRLRCAIRRSDLSNSMHGKHPFDRSGGILRLTCAGLLGATQLRVRIVDESLAAGRLAPLSQADPHTGTGLRPECQMLRSTTVQ